MIFQHSVFALFFGPGGTVLLNPRIQAAVAAAQPEHSGQHIIPTLPHYFPANKLPPPRFVYSGFVVKGCFGNQVCRKYRVMK